MASASLDPLAQPRAVGGGQRLRVAADVRERDVGVAVERAEHVADEGRVQERDVGRGHVRAVGAAVDGGEPGGQALQRPAPLALVLDHLHRGRQVRQVLPRRPDDDDRPVDLPADQPGDPAQERRAVPLQRGLRRAHPRRAPTGENDPRGLRHAQPVPQSAIRPIPGV